MIFGIILLAGIVLLVVMLGSDREVAAKDKLKRDEKTWSKIDGSPSSLFPTNKTFPEKLKELDNVDKR